MGSTRSSRGCGYLTILLFRRRLQRGREAKLFMRTHIVYRDINEYLAVIDFIN